MRCLGLLNIWFPTCRPSLSAERRQEGPIIPLPQTGWSCSSVVPFFVYLSCAAGDVAACWHVSMAEERQGESRSLWGMQTWSRETLQPLWDFQACGETGGGGMLPVFSPWRLNSNLRANYCFAYLHLAHSDYPSIAGNVTTLHLSMVHLSSEPLSECSLICFGFQEQWRERVMVRQLAALLRKRALDSQMRHL